MKRLLMLFRYFSPLLILCLWAVCAYGSEKREEFVPGEIIVKFKEQVSESKSENIIKSKGSSTLSKSPYAGFHRLTIAYGKTTQQMVEIFSKDPDVEYAELNYYAYAHLIPNDPLYPQQWNFNSSGGINIEPAWDITTGDPNVIIAIIDTGVAYEDYHKRPANFIQAPDLANTRFVAGYDFINKDSHPNDDEGHGTHVCGTIAQSTNNSLGVAGIAFNCSIMPVKALDKSGSGPYDTIADAVVFAVNNGAKVINMSLGGTFDSITLRNAVAYAYNHGVTCVCSAGNAGPNQPVEYPAAYDQYCIAVGATTINRTRAYYSNTGSYIDLVAPGGDGGNYQILQQTFLSNPTQFGYYPFSGTSMAAPHVSGVAGLLASRGITAPDQIREALQNSAIDLGTPGRDNEYGYGLINAFATLRYFESPGDFNLDGLADINDLIIFAEHWLQNYPLCDIYPAEGDGIVNFLDLAVLANLFLQ
jgi:serine protease